MDSKLYGLNGGFHYTAQHRQLGGRLGPAWTAERVDDLVEFVQRARKLPVLADPDVPLGYLRRILDETLTSDEHEPPYWSRRVERHRQEMADLRRAQVAADREALRARQTATRATHDAWDAAASSASAGRHAARAIAAAAARRDHTSARRIAAAECDWPEVAQPGTSRPPGLRP